MGSGIVRYNLKKGAMRLWVVASICWAIFTVGFFVVTAPDWPERPQQSIPVDATQLTEEQAAILFKVETEKVRRYEQDKSNFIGAILLALAAVIIVPLLVLLLGHIIAWVVRGFMGDRQA
jgi:Na+-translocating ferredoxin:NAD+ oxidoreductase RnfD subunit